MTHRRLLRLAATLLAAALALTVTSAWTEIQSTEALMPRTGYHLTTSGVPRVEETPCASGVPANERHVA